jgi:uncharacterized membrane protein HdeD (DUF308 family)
MDREVRGDVADLLARIGRQWGLLSIVAGVVALVYPGISLLALAIVLGVWLLAFRARSVGRAASRIAAATSP